MTKNSDKDYAAISQRLLFLKREVARMKRDFLRSVQDIERHVRSLEARCRGPESDAQSSLLMLDVDALRKKVGLRANRALDKLGVVDGVSLARVTVWKLVCVKNCGRSTVDEIKNALKEMGAELPQGEEE